MTQLVRFFVPGSGQRIGVRLNDTVYDMTTTVPSVHQWLLDSVGKGDAAWDALRNTDAATAQYPAADLKNPPDKDALHRLAPVDVQDVWASGVTYERSRAARQEEAKDGGDVYARVYLAQRPELFGKSRGDRVIGPHGEVGIRADSDWDVPEPELTLMLNSAGEVVGLTIGNDMSSRSIEGENPLYLPQAKIYEASCALGPGIVPWTSTDWPVTTIQLAIMRGGIPVFEETIHTSRIHRTMPDLVEYLFRANPHPNGVALMTGTGIIPPSEFTLQAGDVVSITIDLIGTLTNTVKVVS